MADRSSILSNWSSGSKSDFGSNGSILAAHELVFHVLRSVFVLPGLVLLAHRSVFTSFHSVFDHNITFYPYNILNWAERMGGALDRQREGREIGESPEEIRKQRIARERSANARKLNKN
ncbi:hypothetical protein LguiB_030343 [Lonicera macranthoides]